MQFIKSPLQGAIPNSMVVYHPSEYSFDTVPKQNAGFTSILLDTLSLEVDATGKVISVWGLCPYTSWKEARLTPPNAQFAEVFFVGKARLEQEYLSGCTIKNTGRF